jgi:hypothetical protein
MLVSDRVMMGDVRAIYKPDNMFKDTSPPPEPASATNEESGSSSNNNNSTSSTSDRNVDTLSTLVRAATKMNRYSPDDAQLSKPKHVSKFDRFDERSNEDEYIRLHKALLSRFDSNHSFP